MPVHLFELPSCTSCRNAAAWLHAHGVDYKRRHVWNEHPTPAELAELAARLPGGAQTLLSRRSRRFRELGLEGREPTEDELLDLLAGEPRLLRRPIIVDGQRVIVGFDRAALQAAFGR